MAKTLYLVRHAKSSWTNRSLRDFDRPLNKRGLHDAPEMGRRLNARNVNPDIMLCSPARRTRQTIELLLPEADHRIQFDPRIYEAAVDTLINLIRSLPKDCTSAMLIGHNPSIGWLVQELSGRHLEKMPTCAVATIELDTDDWSAAGACGGRLLDFDYPRHHTDG